MAVDAGSALAAQGEAGSGLGRRPLPCQCRAGAIAPEWVSLKASKQADLQGASHPLTVDFFGLLSNFRDWVLSNFRTKPRSHKPQGTHHFEGD
jgi:hypothetical protein